MARQPRMAARAEPVELARAETALTPERLDGEVTRTTGRLRLYGGHVAVTAVLLLLAGLLPLAGVCDPDMWKTFTSDDQQALRAIGEHPVSTEVAGFLIGAGFAVAIPAVAALAGLVGSTVARLAVPLFATGAGLTLADVAFGLKVSYDVATTPSTLPPPSWYEPLNDWGSALFAAGTGVLGAAALLALGVEIVRQREPARWAGWITVVAALLMLGQVAAFGGLLPAPQFLAFVTLGVATAMASRRELR